MNLAQFSFSTTYFLTNWYLVFKLLDSQPDFFGSHSYCSFPAPTFHCCGKLTALITAVTSTIMSFSTIMTSRQILAWPDQVHHSLNPPLSIPTVLPLIHQRFLPNHSDVSEFTNSYLFLRGIGMFSTILTIYTGEWRNTPLCWQQMISATLVFLCWENQWVSVIL